MFCRFQSSAECGLSICKENNYREHFHCLNCDTKVFAKKEDMIRHFKWHKKRKDALRNGFLRSSADDKCSDKFPNREYCGKQTHYHCLKPGCWKVSKLLLISCIHIKYFDIKPGPGICLS